MVNNEKIVINAKQERHTLYIYILEVHDSAVNVK